MSAHESVRAHPANVQRVCTGRRYSRMAWLHTPNWSSESETTAVYRFCSANAHSSRSCPLLCNSVLIDDGIIHLDSKPRRFRDAQKSIFHPQPVFHQQTAERPL